MLSIKKQKKKIAKSSQPIADRTRPRVGLTEKLIVLSLALSASLTR